MCVWLEPRGAAEVKVVTDQKRLVRAGDPDPQHGPQTAGKKQKYLKSLGTFEQLSLYLMVLRNNKTKFFSSDDSDTVFKSLHVKKNLLKYLWVK